MRRNPNTPHPIINFSGDIFDHFLTTIFGGMTPTGADMGAEFCGIGATVPACVSVWVFWIATGQVLVVGCGVEATGGVVGAGEDMLTGADCVIGYSGWGIGAGAEVLIGVVICVGTGICGEGGVTVVTVSLCCCVGEVMTVAGEDMVGVCVLVVSVGAMTGVAIWDVCTAVVLAIGSVWGIWLVTSVVSGDWVTATCVFVSSAVSGIGVVICRVLFVVTISSGPKISPREGVVTDQIVLFLFWLFGDCRLFVGTVGFCIGCPVFGFIVCVNQRVNKNYDNTIYL